MSWIVSRTGGVLLNEIAEPLDLFFEAYKPLTGLSTSITDILDKIGQNTLVQQNDQASALVKRLEGYVNLPAIVEDKLGAELATDIATLIKPLSTVAAASYGDKEIGWPNISVFNDTDQAIQTAEQTLTLSLSADAQLTYTVGDITGTTTTGELVLGGSLNGSANWNATVSPATFKASLGGNFGETVKWSFQQDLKNGADDIPTYKAMTSSFKVADTNPMNFVDVYNLFNQSGTTLTELTLSKSAGLNAAAGIDVNFPLAALTGMIGLKGSLTFKQETSVTITKATNVDGLLVQLNSTNNRLSSFGLTAGVQLDMSKIDTSSLKTLLSEISEKLDDPALDKVQELLAPGDMIKTELTKLVANELKGGSAGSVKNILSQALFANRSTLAGRIADTLATVINKKLKLPAAITGNFDLEEAAKQYFTGAAEKALNALGTVASNIETKAVAAIDKAVHNVIIVTDGPKLEGVVRDLLKDPTATVNATSLSKAIDVIRDDLEDMLSQAEKMLSAKASLTLSYERSNKRSLLASGSVSFEKGQEGAEQAYGKLVAKPYKTLEELLPKTDIQGVGLGDDCRVFSSNKTTVTGQSQFNFGFISFGTKRTRTTDVMLDESTKGMSFKVYGQFTETDSSFGTSRSMNFQSLFGSGGPEFMNDYALPAGQVVNIEASQEEKDLDADEIELFLSSLEKAGVVSATEIQDAVKSVTTREPGEKKQKDSISVSIGFSAADFSKICHYAKENPVEARSFIAKRYLDALQSRAERHGNLYPKAFAASRALADVLGPRRDPGKTNQAIAGYIGASTSALETVQRKYANELGWNNFFQMGQAKQMGFLMYAMPTHLTEALQKSADVLDLMMQPVPAGATAEEKNKRMRKIKKAQNKAISCFSKATEIKLAVQDTPLGAFASGFMDAFYDLVAVSGATSSRPGVLIQYKELGD